MPIVTDPLLDSSGTTEEARAAMIRRMLGAPPADAQAPAAPPPTPDALPPGWQRRGGLNIGPAMSGTDVLQRYGSSLGPEGQAFFERAEAGRDADARNPVIQALGGTQSRYGESGVIPTMSQAGSRLGRELTPAEYIGLLNGGGNVQHLQGGQQLDWTRLLGPGGQLHQGAAAIDAGGMQRLVETQRGAFYSQWMNNQDNGRTPQERHDAYLAAGHSLPAFAGQGGGSAPSAAITAPAVGINPFIGSPAGGAQMPIPTLGMGGGAEPLPPRGPIPQLAPQAATQGAQGAGRVPTGPNGELPPGPIDLISALGLNDRSRINSIQDGGRDVQPGSQLGPRETPQAILTGIGRDNDRNYRPNGGGAIPPAQRNEAITDFMTRVLSRGDFATNNFGAVRDEAVNRFGGPAMNEWFTQNFSAVGRTTPTERAVNQWHGVMRRNGIDVGINRTHALLRPFGQGEAEQ